MARDLAQILHGARRIVFFGGAGVSTESGIPDFRSGGGLYSRTAGMTYAPEQILSHSFFVSHTEEFFAYYRAHLLYPDAKPNKAHRALAALERAGRLSAVITQNIDGLHQAAGSRRVLELHGSVHRNTCLGCGKNFDWEIVLHTTGIPRCDECRGVVKPDVVLYEESLDPEVMEESVDELERADTLIVGGTSLVVYPAAGLIHAFGGGTLVLINKEPTGFDRLASLAIHAPIGETLAPFIEHPD